MCNEDLMESLFGHKAAKEQPKVERKKGPVAFEVPKYIQIIDPRKAQNLSILLRALNVTTDEVCEAILEGDVGQLPVSRVMEETSGLMLEKSAVLFKQKLIVAGASAYARLYDYERIRKGIDGSRVEKVMESVHIAAKKNSLPGVCPMTQGGYT